MNKKFSLKLLLGISVLFLLFANFSLWLTNNIYNAAKFQENILAIYHRQETRDAIASQVIDRILSENPALNQLVNSPAKEAISGILASPTLDPVVQKTAEGLRRYIITGQNEVSLDLAPINNILTALARVAGNQAEAPQIKNTNFVLIPANVFPSLGKWLRPITTLGIPLAIVGLAIPVIIFFKSRDKFAFLRLTGWFVAVGAVLNILLIPVISLLIPQYVTSANLATIALQAFDVFSQSYLTQLILMAMIGLAALLVGYLWPRYKKTKA